MAVAALQHSRSRVLAASSRVKRVKAAGPPGHGRHHLRRDLRHRRRLVHLRLHLRPGDAAVSFGRGHGPRHARPRGRARGAGRVAGARPAKPLAIGIDEYQMYLYELLGDGRLAFFRMADGSLAKEVALDRIAGAASHRGLAHASRATSWRAGTNDGRVVAAAGALPARYEDQRLVDLDIERARPRVSSRSTRRSGRCGSVSYTEYEDRKAVAALVADDEIALLVIDAEGNEQARHAPTREAGEKVTHLRLGRTDGLVAATDKGNLYHWELVPELQARRTSSTRAAQPITAAGVRPRQHLDPRRRRPGQRHCAGSGCG